MANEVVSPTGFWSSVFRALSRSRHAAAAAKFVAPPPPTLADRRAVAAAADILGRLSARRGAAPVVNWSSIEASILEFGGVQALQQRGAMGHSSLNRPLSQY